MAAPEGGKLCLTSGRSERSERSPEVTASSKRVPEGGQPQPLCHLLPLRDGQQTALKNCRHFRSGLSEVYLE